MCLELDWGVFCSTWAFSCSTLRSNLILRPNLDLESTANDEMRVHIFQNNLLPSCISNPFELCRCNLALQHFYATLYVVSNTRST